MHLASHKNGHVYDDYDNTTAKAANDYLCRVFSLIRAKLGNDSVPFYGMRVVEPHHDGTPHWHLLVFVHPEHTAHLTRVFRHYALLDSGDEPGARKHRFTSVPIDPEKGNATGYVAKYIAKNIDGFGMSETDYGENAQDSSWRVKAWASVNRIRQFQGFGEPPVSVWRELRRIKGFVPSILKPFKAAAESPDWKAYMTLMGGPETKRSDRPVKLLKQWSDRLNEFGEAAGETVIGLKAGTVEVITHIHQWTIAYPDLSKGNSRSNFTLVKGSGSFSKANLLEPIANHDPAIAEKSALGDSLALGSGFCSSLEFCQ